MGDNKTFRRLIRNHAAIAGLSLLIVLTICAIFSSVLVPHNPDAQSLLDRLQAPSLAHWLGTDGFGRDIFSRLLAGTSVTFTAVGLALVISMGLGVTVGLFAGSTGGWVDGLITKFADGILALPALILVLAIIGILGPGLVPAMTALGLILAPRFFRVARGAAQAVSQEAFIEAARADGCSTWRILWRHVVPNSLGPIIVEATFAIGIIITAEASLSFLGLGVQLPQSSWGSMLNEGFQMIRIAPYPIFPPSAMIVVTTLAAFLLGDGLRDVFSGRAKDR